MKGGVFSDGWLAGWLVGWLAGSLIFELILIENVTKILWGGPEQIFVDFQLNSN